MRRRGAWVRLAGRALAALLFTLGTPARSADPDIVGWRTIERDGVSVVARPEDVGYAAHVLEVALSKGESVARAMSLPGLRPLSIAIAASDEEFSDLASHGAPDWEVACAFPERGLIVLRSPRIVAYPVQMEAVIVHELAHVAAGRVLAGVRVPRWFDEGIAMEVAGEWPLDEASPLGAAAAAAKLIPLSQLEDGFPPGRSAAALAYAEGFYAVGLLLRQSGVRGPAELVRAVAAAGDFDQAVLSLAGTSRGRFEEAALRSLGRGFGWALLLKGWGLLFLVLGGGVIVTVAVVARRRARRLESWEDGIAARSGRAQTRSRSSWD
jgi:hypothetical protein